MFVPFMQLVHRVFQASSEALKLEHETMSQIEEVNMRALNTRYELMLLA